MPAEVHPAVVVDASAVAAVAFGEPAAGQVVSLVADGVLHAPTLLPYELASVARRKAAREPTRAGDILQALDMALRLDVRWVDVDQRTAVKLALEEGITAYDAAYLCVAMALSAPLLTLDHVLERAARRRGVTLRA